MQHINDDIDELLRNAAESYPLKINGADWEGVSARLSGEEGQKEPGVVVPFTTGAKKYRKYLLAMLLIPFGLILAKYAGLIGGGKSDTAIHTDRTVKTAPKADKIQGAGTTADIIKPSNAQQAHNDNAVAAATINTGVENSIDKGKASVKRNTAQFSMHVADAAMGTKVIEDKNKPSNIPHLSDLPVLQHQQDIAVVNGSHGQVTIEPNQTPEATNDLLGTTPKVPASSTAGQPSTAEQPQVGKTEDPLLHHNTRKGYFYIGAFVAPEYTTVKYQPGSKVGFNFGGFVGYTLTTNLSVEVGLAAGRKYYTSDGKYFNSKEPWLSNWGKIINISGYASLTEIPVNFKYNFKPGKDGNFFAAAGLVSYIVHQENYDYILDKNGVVYTRTKSPIVSTDNLFANASVSAGYESSLGGLCNFRIEPYYRIPITGIGIGSLPITSIGLNIGVTKKFK